MRTKLKPTDICKKCGNVRENEKYCRTCKNISVRAWENANRERCRENRKIWEKNNPDSVIASTKKHRDKERDNVTISYTARSLGMKSHEITPEMNRLHKESISAKRELRKLTESIK